MWGYNGVYGSGTWGNFGGNNDLRFTFKLGASAPLRIELTNFTAHQLGNAAQLDWQTASERNNEGFELQRSVDSKNWHLLAFLPDHGTSQTEQSYTYADEHPRLGVNYYRLKQVDFDGLHQYSNITEIAVKRLSSGITFFPNPARQGVTSLFLPEVSEAVGILEIFDGVGHKVYYQNLQPEGGDQLVPVDLSNYASGIYLARLQLGSEVRTERLVVVK